jgi:SAM-dependent methyltransferase
VMRETARDIMDVSILQWLRCPFCSGHLSVSGMDRPTSVLSYGVLSCYCGRYPVVAGIPVLKKGVIGTDGQTSDEVIRLIETKRYRETLLSLIVPASQRMLTGRWLPIKRVLGGGMARRLEDYCSREWRQRTFELLTNSTTGTACDFLQHYFRGEKQQGQYEYFAYRYSTERYLIGLSLVASLFAEPTKRVLDLGCGCGNLTWALTQHARSVVALDVSFYELCVAKSWTAPDAIYICCAADGGLPFAGSTFSSVFCSDAFHYFLRKVACISELKRVTEEDGLFVLTWVRNALAKQPPHAHVGVPLPPAGYESLVSEIPHRLIADSEILRRYVSKQGPCLVSSMDGERFKCEPVLSLIASYRQELFKDYGTFTDWPHAQGRLSLNPLYMQLQKASPGKTSLRRTFPSQLWEEINPECKFYLPEELEINGETLTALKQGKRTEEMRNLIDKFVILATPERYGVPSLRIANGVAHPLGLLTAGLASNGATNCWS